ncbi:unnamed protein product [Caenorhabditis auriculariae]|uniref:Uncharacterized protein n=1 Tax=Caenorhabditis auriculariae TaxID=2777116 RepID=A0A8S1H6W9_9PELO|nr:unnamed protein product [Caenorhabditis auriculariae]
MPYQQNLRRYRGIIAIQNYDREFSFVHLFANCQTACLPASVARNRGYDDTSLCVGDIVVVRIAERNNESDLLKKFYVVELCLVEERRFQQNGRWITGTVVKISHSYGYYLRNEVLGIVGDQDEIFEGLSGWHTYSFKAKTIDRNNSVEEVVYCEGVVVGQHNHSERSRLYIFTKGCRPYTDILAVVPDGCSSSVFPSGTFVSFLMTKSDYNRRSYKKNLRTDYASLRVFNPPDDVASIIEDGEMFIILRRFSTSPFVLWHYWLGNFDDPERILEADKTYAEIKLREFSEPDKPDRNPWVAVLAKLL